MGTTTTWPRTGEHRSAENNALRRIRRLYIKFHGFHFSYSNGSDFHGTALSREAQPVSIAKATSTKLPKAARRVR